MKVTTVGTVNNSGTMGGITAVNVRGHIYYRSRRAKLPKGARMTYGQRRGQAQLATLTSAYHPLADLLKVSLLRTSPMERVYNLFTKYNMARQEALLPKEEVDRGFQLLDHYTVSRGTGALPTIDIRTEEGMHVIGLRLIDLELTPETTLSQFTFGVGGLGSDRGEGGLLTFVVCDQQFSQSGGRARIEVRQATLPLQYDVTGLGSVPVMQLLPGIDLRTVERPEGRLLALPAKDYQLVTVIYSRRMKDQRIDSSEQRLVGRSPYLDTLLDEQRREEAILSYGPVKKETLPEKQRSSQPARGFTLQDFMEGNLTVGE